MKKILAMLLVFAMVLPLCVGVTATSAESNVEIKPFNISTSLKEGFDNIWPKIHFWSRANEDYVTEDSVRVSVPDVGGKTPKEVAENLKPVFDAYPDGMRYISFSAFRAAMITLLEDSIFMDKGLKVIKAWFEEFLAHYHSIGGKLDGISVDIEYVEGYYYYLSQDANKDPYV